MMLTELIHKKSARMKTATATVATHFVTESPTVANVASVAVAKDPNETNKNIIELEKITKWLFRIGEPEEDHYLVLNKCKNDPEAFAYFMNCVRQEEENSDSGIN